MVLVEGLAQPYETGAILHHRRVAPIQELSRTPPLNPEESGGPVPEQARLMQKAKAAYDQAEHLGETQRRRLGVARDIMQSPVSFCSPEASLREVWEIFSEKRFRHLPVSRDGQTLLGLISDRDVLRHAPSVATPRPGGPSHSPVKEMMVTRLLTGHPNTEIRTIARVLLEERIGCLPILDDEHRLVGIITRSDVLRTLVREAPMELWG